jgi:hypothetical protein
MDATPGPVPPSTPKARRPFRAWDLFLWTLAAAFLCFLAFLGASLWEHQTQGELTTAQSTLLLGLLRYGTYPLVFVSLGALFWHLVKSEMGGYARR